MAQTNTIAGTVRDLGIVREVIISYDSEAPMLGRAGLYVPAPVGMFGQIRLARQDGRTHPQRQIDQRWVDSTRKSWTSAGASMPTSSHGGRSGCDDRHRYRQDCRPTALAPRCGSCSLDSSGG